MNKENKEISALNIAAIYIGPLIGAGFASGQEIYQFFVFFGNKGIIGLLVTMGLFVFFGYAVMYLAKKLNTGSYKKVIIPFDAKALTITADAVITFFLFGVLAVMIAAAGSVFGQQFGLPKIAGSLFLAGLVALTALMGMNKIIRALSIIVPLMLTLAMTVSILSILLLKLDVSAAVEKASSPLVSNWFASAVSYFSYNMLLAVGVLSPVGIKVSGNKKALMGAALGGTGFAVTAGISYYAMLKSIGIQENVVLPMIYLAEHISPTMGLIYTAALLLGIYSSALSCMFGFLNRVSEINLIKRYNTGIKVTVIIIVAFFASLFGFSNLLAWLYPLIGYVGIGIFIMIAAGYIKARYGVQINIKGFNAAAYEKEITEHD